MRKFVSTEPHTVRVFTCRLELIWQVSSQNISPSLPNKINVTVIKVRQIILMDYMYLSTDMTAIKNIRGLCKVNVTLCHNAASKE